jgi:hypothetical protein
MRVRLESQNVLNHLRSVTAYLTDFRAPREIRQERSSRGAPRGNDPTVSYAVASFSTTELAELLRGITDIRHVFS